MVEQTTIPARDVTVPLLTRIIEESLDQDYRRAADRRAAVLHDTLASNPVPSRERDTSRPGRSALLVLALFGLLVGTAFVESAQSAGDAELERSGLVAQIENRREHVTAQQQELTDLRSETRSLDDELQALQQDISNGQATIARLEPPTGFAPATGPGIRIVIDDALDADASRLVRADDLAILVNGLWAAGAEAISIDDQRLTTLTSLRNSGLTIGVNRVSLRAPYTVRAIGNPQTLEANLLDSTSGLAWAALADELGFQVQVQNEPDMSLPSAFLRPLRSATLMQEAPSNDAGQEDRP